MTRCDGNLKSPISNFESLHETPRHSKKFSPGRRKPSAVPTFWIGTLKKPAIPTFDRRKTSPLWFHLRGLCGLRVEKTQTNFSTDFTGQNEQLPTPQPLTNWPDTGQSWPNTGQSRPTLARTWPTACQPLPNMANQSRSPTAVHRLPYLKTDRLIWNLTGKIPLKFQITITSRFS
jgi:hypothetical protein